MMPVNERPRGFVMWPADFLSDPKVAAMDTTEVGAYWLLCLYAAQSEVPGTLPNDEALLARLSRLGDRWPDHRDRVLKAWTVGPKSITQKRLALEIGASAERKASATNAGKRSARIKAARAIATHTEGEWSRLVVACGEKCVRCGGNEGIVKDHIVPVYQGGSDGIANLQPLCVRCNANKGQDSTDFRPQGWQRAFNERSTSVQQDVGVGVGVGVGEAESKAAAPAEAGSAPEGSGSPTAASDLPLGSDPSGEPGRGCTAETSATPCDVAPGENRQAVLGLIAGLTGALASPTTHPAKKLSPADAAWRWLRENSAREFAGQAMRFVGWLMSTGTNDSATLLALTKDYVVHRPKVPHAYYTPNGSARQAIAMRVASDRAVAEHERIKSEEREFLGRKDR